MATAFSLWHFSAFSIIHAYTTFDAALNQKRLLNACDVTQALWPQQVRDNWTALVNPPPPAPHPSAQHHIQLSNIEDAHLVHLCSWLTAPGCVRSLASSTLFNLDTTLSGVLDSKSEERSGRLMLGAQTEVVRGSGINCSYTERGVKKVREGRETERKRLSNRGNLPITDRNTARPLQSSKANFNPARPLIPLLR